MKIVLSGYYGFDNAGDEAVLYSIVEALQSETEGRAEITVLSNNPEKTKESYRVSAVNRWHLPSVTGAIRKSDLLISGGGSLLQDTTGPKSIVYYLGVVGIARAFGVPAFFYSQGIGPIRGRTGKLLTELVTNRVSEITVRDEKSKLLLEELKVKRPAIGVTADPVMGIDRGKVDLKIGRDIIGKKPAVGLALRNWEGFNDIVPDLADWCSHKIEEGIQVVFIPFHTPEDVEACEMVAAKVNCTCKVLPGGYLPVEYLSIIGNLDFVVGMRLHALIMAGAMGTPMAGISYDPKVSAYLKQVVQPLVASLEEDTEQENTRKLTKSLEGAFVKREELKEELLKHAPRLSARAREAAKMAVSHIVKNNGR